jgi:hypothetical protein
MAMCSQIKAKWIRNAILKFIGNIHTQHNPVRSLKGYGREHERIKHAMLLDSHLTYGFKKLFLLLPSTANSLRTPFQHVLHFFTPHLYVSVIPCTQIIGLTAGYSKWSTAGSFHGSIHDTKCSNQISCNNVWRLDPV